MPTIDAHRAYRSFTVEPGAVLDLRWVRLFRGKPIRIIRRCALCLCVCVYFGVSFADDSRQTGRLRSLCVHTKSARKSPPID